MRETVYLRQMELGPMQNFVYLIGDPETRDCVVVDPAWEIDAIVDQVERDGMKLSGVLVTHTHQDHVGGHLFGFDIPGVEELLGRAPAKVYVHKAEREFLRGFGSDLVKVDGGDTVSVGRVPVSFIHTPGHTPGSQCFLVDGRLVSGDTLFIRALRADGLAGQRSEGDVLFADAAAGRSPRLDDGVPRSQLRRRIDHHRRREAAKPDDALRLHERFPARDGPINIEGGLDGPLRASPKTKLRRRSRRSNTPRFRSRWCRRLRRGLGL